MGFGKDGKGAILKEVSTITIGGLAAQSVIKGASAMDLQSTPFRIIKTEYFVNQTAAWAAEGDGIIIGIANGELSVAEIAEAMTIDGPDDFNDRNGMERAERAVWLLVHLQEPQVGTFSDPANNGLAIEKVLRWTFGPTEGWDWFAYNPSSAAITTGPVFRITAKIFGVWRL